MASERASIDISTSADLRRLAEEVATSGTSRVLVRGDEELAIVTPLPAAGRRSPRPRKRLQPERVLDIIGRGASGGSDIARFKDDYIADAVDHRGA
jgi:hypothetical protein